MKHIAIIGGGPAGCTLANILANQGCRVGLFHMDKRPPLIVGESLLPSVIPILKRLSIEDEVRSFSTYKPGATIWLGPQEKPDFDFKLGKSSLEYAYNTPRDQFDDCLLRSAEKAGARVFKVKATLEKGGLDGEIRLSSDTIRKTDNYFKGKIDLIIDASGRSRVVPRLLDLESIPGQRKDVALFAHWENVEISEPGNIHVDRYDQGWGWRIPLPGKTSVGIVVNPDHLKTLGDTPEEQYDHFVKTQKGVNQFTKSGKRISPVVRYNNYQLKTKKYFGNNWALIGDTAGFIDPVFSTGLYLSMISAVRLADVIIAGGKVNDYKKYEQEHQSEILKWQNIIDLWYDGRLFTLFRMGQIYKDSIIGKLLDGHMSKHITKIFTGEVGTSGYSGRLLKFMTTYGIRNLNPEDLKIY